MILIEEKNRIIIELLELKFTNAKNGYEPCFLTKFVHF
jgi:hypothetical protein